MNILPLILARGGSKGLPRKNILPLNGKPLIAYIIESALQVFPSVFVSTDDKEIADIAFHYKAIVYMRPPELASDTAKSIDAVKSFLIGKEADAICLLNACCPLTSREDIFNAVELFKSSPADSVVSLVQDFSCHPSKVCHLSEDDEVEPLAGFKTGERQLLPATFKRNTAIYIAKREVIESGTFFGLDTRGYVMPKSRSYDINDKIDFDICEFLINQHEKRDL